MLIFTSRLSLRSAFRLTQRHEPCAAHGALQCKCPKCLISSSCRVHAAPGCMLHRQSAQCMTSRSVPAVGATFASLHLGPWTSTEITSSRSMHVIHACVVMSTRPYGHGDMSAAPEDLFTPYAHNTTRHNNCICQVPSHMSTDKPMAAGPLCKESSTCAGMQSTLTWQKRKRVQTDLYRYRTRRYMRYRYRYK